MVHALQLAPYYNLGEEEDRVYQGDAKGEVIGPDEVEVFPIAD